MKFLCKSRPRFSAYAQTQQTVADLHSWFQAMRVAILGAPVTGKTELAIALGKFLTSQGIPLEVADSPDIQSLEQEDIVLLCGLDLAFTSEVQSGVDQELRAGLQTRGMVFQVVYGKGSLRLQNALFCLATQTPQWAHLLRRDDLPVRWTGPCETCGDGLCEHQLFTKLVSNKD